MDEDDSSDQPHATLDEDQQDNEIFTHTDRNDELKSPTCVLGTPHRTEPKMSLSEYQTTRSLSASGVETSMNTNNENNTSNIHLLNVVDISVGTFNNETSLKTSTPNRPDVNIDPTIGAAGFSPVRRPGTGSVSSSVGANRPSSVRDTRSSTFAGTKSETKRNRVKRVSFVDPLDITVPLVGFEVMEERAKFTVFKLHVQKGTHDNWFVFRRYTDFEQLQKNLKMFFPMYRLTLPPKRWFRNNYDREFIEERMLGLQAFIDSILCHSDLCNSVPVQDFFCFSDPPGPHDSLEESRAYCDELEEAVYNLKKELHSKETENELLRDELGLYKSQVEILTKTLREAYTTGATSGHGNLSPSNSLAECDLLIPEIDLSKPMSLKDEIDQSELAALRAMKSSQSDTLLKYNNGGINKKNSNRRKSGGVSKILPSS